MKTAKKHEKERLYHIVAIIKRTEKQVFMTMYPMNHAECCTMKSKISEHKGRRIVLVPD